MLQSGMLYAGLAVYVWFSYMPARHVATCEVAMKRRSKSWARFRNFWLIRSDRQSVAQAESTICSKNIDTEDISPFYVSRSVSNWKRHDLEGKQSKVRNLPSNRALQSKWCLRVHQNGISRASSHSVISVFWSCVVLFYFGQAMKAKHPWYAVHALHIDPTHWPLHRSEVS